MPDHSDPVGGVVADGVQSSSPIFSCLIGGSSSTGDLEPRSSTFLLLPLGAGSRGVRQYVTVRVTT